MQFPMRSQRNIWRNTGQDNRHSFRLIRSGYDKIQRRAGCFLSCLFLWMSALHGCFFMLHLSICRRGQSEFYPKVLSVRKHLYSLFFWGLISENITKKSSCLRIGIFGLSRARSAYRAPRNEVEWASGLRRRERSKAPETTVYRRRWGGVGTTEGCLGCAERNPSGARMTSQPLMLFCFFLAKLSDFYRKCGYVLNR